MVEPLDAQNMISRAPLVEKTVAAHRENAPQTLAQVEQFQKERRHQDENVQLQRESLRSEAGQEQPGSRNPTPDPKPGSPAAIVAGVELVQESTDTPEHHIDISV